MIDDENRLQAELSSLLKADPRLERIARIAGPLPLRRGMRGLPGLAATMIGQQVSRASATAILGRLAGAIDLADAAAILAASDDTHRMAGMSRGKQRTLLAIASAVITGELDFDRVAANDAPEAIAELTAIPGIGPWTAESYLLFCLGHPDVFPAGDLALQIAVAHALALEPRPKERPLRAIAELWAPHRATAARLFWAYYAAINRRDAAPVQPPAPAGE